MYNFNHMNYELNKLVIDEIIIYLRKSRQDDPNETVEEVLNRHEIQLQDYALRVWGARIPEENIYREVVSGETIDDRPEIKKVMERVQDSRTKAVLVVECSRLTRGDMLDLGTMVHVLRYTSTLCITLDRYYNLEDKHHRRAFEDELKRGGDYLEYTKEILMRGRRLSASQGYWVLSKPPFGFDREEQPNGKFILVPNESTPAVRMIYEWFADGVSKCEIINRLHKAGIRPMEKKTLKWAASTITRILTNDVYIGIIRFGEKKTIRVYEDGVLKKKKVPAPESEHIVAKGKHDPIIPIELWERVQQRIGNCDRTKADYELSNPLAGLLACKKCGRMMRRNGRSDGEHYARFACTTAPHCDTKSVRREELFEAFQASLRANVVELEAKVDSGAESRREAKEAQLAALESRLQKLQDQEDHQYELLEKREYTPEVFNRRHAKLVKEMDTVRAAIEEARETMPDVIDYEDALVRLHAAIDAMDSPDMSALEKNMILKTIVSRIEYSREKGKKNNPFELDVFLNI